MARSARVVTLTVMCVLTAAVAAVTATVVPADAAKPPPKGSTEVLYDDLPPAGSPSANFAVTSRWPKTRITYAFENGTSDIAGTSEYQAVRDAFALWSAPGVLAFTEVALNASPDIRISWRVGDHGDGSPFDGQNGVLAHAFYPTDGRVHFDDAETWTLSTRTTSQQPIDLVTVAAHEIGHALGLGHSADPSALMWHAYSGSHRYLSSDDLAGINSAYPSPYSQWLLRNQNSGGSAQLQFSYGVMAYQHLACDWDGDGIDEPVVYEAPTGMWYGRSTVSAGSPNISFAYGYSGTTAVCGDWNGNGTDDVGVYINGTWMLRNSFTAGPPEIQFDFGYSAAKPVVGNWDGLAGDGIGVYDNGAWSLRQTPSPGPPQLGFSYGYAGAAPVAGNWDGVGGDGIGIFDADGVAASPGTWHLRQSASAGSPDITFAYGWVGYRPIVGDWDGAALGQKGTDTVGVIIRD